MTVTLSRRDAIWLGLSGLAASVLPGQVMAGSVHDLITGFAQGSVPVEDGIILSVPSEAPDGFAVPVDTINRVVPSLIAYGRYVRPSIGISASDDIGRRLLGSLDVDGVRRERVFDGARNGAERRLVQHDVGPLARPAAGL